MACAFKGQRVAVQFRFRDSVTAPAGGLSRSEKSTDGVWLLQPSGAVSSKRKPRRGGARL